MANATSTSKPAPTALDIRNKALMAAAASQKASTNTEPEKPDCAEKAEMQAVILYPALGTPLVAPASQTKIKLFLIVEDKCVKEFGIDGSDAHFAWYYINTHLHILPFKTAGKISADLKSKRLYISKAAAKAGIKVWYKGPHGSSEDHLAPAPAYRPIGALTPKLGWSHRLIDHQGHIVANVRQSAVHTYVHGTLSDGQYLTPAYPSRPQISDTTNQPLPHLFEVELDFAGLTEVPKPDAMYTLAWMVTCVYKDEKMAFREKVTHWEHQDKLVYDFFALMQKNKQHYAKPFAFNLKGLAPDKWPEQDLREISRIKPFHPFIFKSGKSHLDLGHLSDIHCSSRQFALAQSDAVMLEGSTENSTPLGKKVANCLVNCQEVINKFKSGKDKVDALFITGDLLDFNRNLDASKVPGKKLKDQWESYNLAAKLDDNDGLYPRGLDSMLMYSLIKDAYADNLPVFMTTGNHEAYDEPYGISPRTNSYAAKLAANPSKRATTVHDALGASKTHEPTKALKDYDPNDVAEIDLNWAPNVTPRKANEGIPADHNLTIYEACLIYGPTYPQIMQSWNYMKDNYDWFFTLFTPLADFVASYQDQLITGLEWGNSERMLEGSIIPDGLLPRAIEPITATQQELLANVIARQPKTHLVFSHFTVVNYGQKTPFSEAKEWHITEVSDALTSGTFEQRREQFVKWIAEKKIHGHYSGHSHRTGGYHMQVDGTKMKVKAHSPAQQTPDAASQLWVTSCAGGLGIQNFCHELAGWNLMPPSGNRIDGASGRVTAVVTPDTPSAKPRFCVALDYLQCHAKQQVMSWEMRETPPRLVMRVTSVKNAEPFIKGVSFHVWGQEGEFDEFKLEVNFKSRGEMVLLYDAVAERHAELFSALSRRGARVFVRIEFNRKLAESNDIKTASKLYAHYNFDDPWIFKIKSEPLVLANNQVWLRIRFDPKAEVPDWDWLGGSFENKYPLLKSILDMKRAGNR